MGVYPPFGLTLTIILSIIAVNVEKLTAFLRSILMVIFSRFRQHLGAAW